MEKKTGKTIFIVTGGPMGDRGFLQSQIRERKPHMVICADGGIRHLAHLGIAPQVLIGDMDSLDTNLLSKWQGEKIKVLRHPPDKKETDTELALNYAFDAKPRQIDFFGALGARIDHSLANIALLVRCKEKNIKAKILDEWCELYLADRETIIEGEVGQTVSLLPLGDRVRGINLQGFVYPLNEGEMRLGFPYGISNRLQEKRGVISVKEGNLLVIHFRFPDRFPQGS